MCSAFSKNCQTNESWHTGMSHVMQNACVRCMRTKNVTQNVLHTNESSHESMSHGKHEWVTSRKMYYIWMRHVTKKWVVAQRHTSCHEVCDLSCVVNTHCNASDTVMSQNMRLFRRVMKKWVIARIHESCHARFFNRAPGAVKKLQYKWVMAQSNESRYAQYVTYEWVSLSLVTHNMLHTNVTYKWVSLRTICYKKLQYKWVSLRTICYICTICYIWVSLRTICYIWMSRCHKEMSHGKKNWVLPQENESWHE